MQLNGVIKSVIYSSKSFAVISVQTDKGIKRAAGFIQSPVPGQKVSMEGEWVKHEKYGKQFKVDSSHIEEPEEKSEGVVNYLHSGFLKGVGPAITKRIYEKFGERALDILEKEPEQYLSIAGITPSKLEVIQQAHRDNGKYRALCEYLGDAATVYQIQRIYEKYGERSVGMIKANPYQLIYDLEGFGFERVDKLAYGCGITGNHPQRVKAAIVHTLRAVTQEGHCFLHKESLKENLKEHLKMKVDDTIFEEEIKSLLEDKRIVLEDGAVYLTALYQYECLFGMHLDRIVNSQPKRMVPEFWIQEAIEEIETKENIKYDKLQKDAVYTIYQNNLTLLTGGPGTGKTTLIKTILAAWGDRESVMLMAPTGRASRRIAEVTGYPASTIHKSLGYAFINGKMDFCSNENNPLTCDLLIVDETHMIDLPLAASLMRAVANGTKVVLIGDMDQLPPIGPGNIFRDLITSLKVASIRLTNEYRLSGSVDKNTKSVNEGRGVHTWIQDENFRYIPMQVKDMQATVIDEYLQLAQKYGTANTLCLTGVNQRSKVGTHKLNRLIQSRVNPHTSGTGLKSGDREFFEGDRIIQNTPDYQKSVPNGSMGTIRLVDPENGIARIEFDTGETIEYERSDLIKVRLGYAITVHKAMGSQFQAVVIAFYAPPQFLYRNFLYTALSRVEKVEVVIGDPKAIDRAIGRNDPVFRNSRVKERFHGIRKGKNVIEV